MSASVGSRSARVGAVLTAALLLVLVACGGDRELAGYVRTPAPSLVGVTLPELTADGADFELRAAPGRLLVIYFGYTNCPDYCPTTMQDLRIALRSVAEADRVDVAMVTVDPERDNSILGDYVRSFFPDGIALGTPDAGRLARAAEPFGVSYAVTTAADGDVEVAHSTQLFAVDPSGDLIITWPFGLDRDELARDIDDLLDGIAA
ncbi:MAG: SCO family protein [Ilumatobacteraceae bacterium]